MNRRKNQQQVSESPLTSGGILTVGLDIGYGVTKVVTDQTAIAFPSVAGHAREIKFQQEALAAKYPGDQLTDEDGSTWFVGDLALAQLPPGDTRTHRQRKNDGQYLPSPSG